jgi:hypothetical protein
MQGAVTLRKSKLHQRLREFLFHSSRFPILPVNVFIVSVPCFLRAPLSSKYRNDISFKGGRL